LAGPAVSGADRQRRLRERRRRHAEGDHELCIPGRCEAKPAPDLDTEGLNDGGGDAGQGVTRDVTAAPKISVSQLPRPADLGEPGRKLWDGMSGLKLGPTHVLLLERACRLADRLARLDALLEGGDWLDLAIQRTSTDTTLEVRVTVDRALGETRQHDVALKLLVAELRHAGRPAAAAGTPPPAEDDGPKEGAAGGNVTSIAAIRGSARG
jgi:hypothetical protein